MRWMEACKAKGEIGRRGIGEKKKGERREGREGRKGNERMDFLKKKLLN